MWHHQVRAGTSSGSKTAGWLGRGGGRWRDIEGGVTVQGPRVLVTVLRGSQCVVLAALLIWHRQEIALLWAGAGQRPLELRGSGVCLPLCPSSRTVTA